MDRRTWGHYMLTHHNNVYLFGGYQSSTIMTDMNEILKLKCQDTIDTCKFVKHGEMQYGRADQTVIPISDDILYKFGCCGCNEDGSVNEECNESGQCQCKENVVGVKCDSCSPGHLNNFPGCKDCKENVVGEKCDVCSPGYFGFPECQGMYVAYT